MSKYDALRRRLAATGGARIAMTFDEIEALLGFPLPASARRHRAFWSNNPDNNVMTRAWREAGYRTADVDLARGALAFVPEREWPLAVADQTPEEEHAMAEAAAPWTPAQPGAGASGKRPKHPIIGCMKGTVTLLPDVDLTEPADPEWGRRAYGDGA